MLMPSIIPLTLTLVYMWYKSPPPRPLKAEGGGACCTMIMGSQHSQVSKKDPTVSRPIIFLVKCLN